ncbi:MAG: HAD family phosphatase [Chloroflexi bacterium]|nr:HAD family phosphatase [Chloroflexota bacterium]
MTHPITAIIFDFGNVFVKWDPREVYKRFFPSSEAIDSFLEEIRFTEWNAHQDAGRPFKEGVAELTKQFPHYSNLIEAYKTHWEDSITETIIGTVEIAYKLKSAGWDLYLLSNFSAETFPLMQRRYSFLSLFDDMIISGEHKIVKPGPSIFDLALNRLNREARECMFIDDSLPNIETAKKLGFNTIQFHSPEQLEDDLKSFLGEYAAHGN